MHGNGVPISVKEHVDMKGLCLDPEYIACWDEAAKEDAHFFQLLQCAGIVVHARNVRPRL